MIDYGLKNKVVLVTGANNPHGIGATTALRFAREGAKVVLVYKKLLEHLTQISLTTMVQTDIMQPMLEMPMKWNTNSRK